MSEKGKHGNLPRGQRFVRRALAGRGVLFNALERRIDAPSFQLGSLRSNESSPIVIGDTIYVSTSWGPKYVYAVNAATGERKWTYEPEIPDDVLQYACCDVNNRGVTYAAGRIFVGRLDGKLAAVDAATGKELWVTTVVDYKQGSVRYDGTGSQGGC
ncbi:MAG: PQQ-binding-like beta-propeller repeat protein [Rhodopila sp.]